MVIFVADSDLARSSIERCLHRMLERRASLDEVVAQESKSALLSEYGLVLIDGTVFEAKYQLVRDTISARDLCHLTVSDGLAVMRSQHKKAMHQAFHVPHGYRIC